MLPPWISESADDEGFAFLNIHVQPGAKRSEIVGPHGDDLKIRVAAPAVDGKANEALLAFLVKRLGLLRQHVTLIGGQTSRKKRLRISSTCASEIFCALCPKATSRDQLL